MSEHPYADLHIHTNHSDGQDTPEIVVKRASELGVAALSITDHDQISANPIAESAAANTGIQYLHGTEITARHEYLNVDVLGYGFDSTNLDLQNGLAAMQEARRKRMEEMLFRLDQACGIKIPYESLTSQDHDKVSLGRMHLALELKKLGITRRTQEGFDRFLKAGRPAYVPAAAMSVTDAITLVQSAGGLAFLAHPGLMKHVRKSLNTLLEYPFDGLEVFHISHSPGHTDAFLQIALERKLLVCGGSDCHGAIRDHANMGKIRLPFHHYEAICEALHR